MENSWLRLVDAAGLSPDEDERKVVSLLVAQMGKLVGTTPQQTISNWRTRGVSLAGALAAQRTYRCDANWLLTGSGAKNLTWPFTPDLQDEVKSLNTDGLVKLEGVMRAHLGMAPISAESLQDLSSHPMTDESVAGNVPKTAGQKPSRVSLNQINLGTSSASHQHGQVRKPRRGGSA